MASEAGGAPLDRLIAAFPASVGLGAAKNSLESAAG